MAGLAGTAAALAVLTGCSSSPPQQQQQPAGALPPGTAEISIDGDSAGPTDNVSCSQVGWTTIVDVGDKKSGAQLIFDTNEDFTPTSVQITDLADFTGAFWVDKVGEAEMTLLGSTYEVTGTARGYTSENPRKDIMTPFTFKANC